MAKTRGKKSTSNVCERKSVAVEKGTVSYFCVFPKGKPKAVVQINHGITEHSGRYERFGLALAKAGYAAYGHDNPGHGHTELEGARPGYLGQSGGWDMMIQTVSDMHDMIDAAHPDIPVITFGHSMGSIISMNFAMRYPDRQAALALWNSGVETGVLAVIYGAILKTQRFFKGSDVPSPIAEKLTFKAWNKEFAPNRTESDWLSRDEAEVDKFVADPLCGFEVRIGLWIDMLNGIYFAADNKNLAALPSNMPVHLLAGDKDPCTECGKAVANIQTRMKDRGMSNVTFELLKDARHESLNELNYEETTAMFIDWLDEQIG